MKPRKLMTICLVASVVTGIASAALVDLAANLSGTVTAATGQQTTFERYDPDQSTGTGVFKPFVRIQHNGTEKGYNTDGAIEFDTKGGIWTHSIKLGEIPVIEGDLGFLLDTDQNNSAEGRFISLEVVEIYLADSPSLTVYATNIDGADGVQLIYDLGENWVKMNNELFKPGSGTGDVRMLIENNPAWDTNKYLYFYTEMGGHNASNDGFEEWGIFIPEPATMLLLGLGGLVIRRKRR